MRDLRIVVTLAAALAYSLSACADDEGTSAEPESTRAAQDTVCGTTDATGDLLAQICEEGTITVSTDPKYPPQSSLDQKTGDYVGFDIDTATAIADRLGVDVAWETPGWNLITAGSWNGRWDMSVGSMTPTNDRQEVLDFTPPYYYTPAVVAVHEANTTSATSRPTWTASASASAVAAPTSSSSTSRWRSRASSSTSS
jgi:polar amino acid transport system substrate-binding protein